MDDLYLIGNFIKKERKRQKKTQEDLADDQVSRSTISNVENGLGADTDKIYHILGKLGIHDRIDKVISEYKKERVTLEFQLEAAEDMIRYDAPNAKEQLKKLKSSLEPNGPFFPCYIYLNGQANRYKHPQTAMKYFQNAIETAEKSVEYDPNDNIISACYLYSGVISYYGNDLTRAIQYSTKAIDTFQNGGQREEILHKSLFNKALFYIKKGYFIEADQVIKELSTHIPHSHNSSLNLKFMQLNAQKLRFKKDYTDAVYLIRSAIKQARDNKLPNISFTLWSTLGKTLQEMKLYDLAKRSYDTALSFQESVTSKSLIVETYIDLGKLYTITGQWDKAENMISLASDIARKSNDTIKLVNAICSKGDMHQKQGHIKESVSLYDDALKLAKEFQLLHKQEELLYKLACFTTDDEKRHKYLDERLSIEQQLKRRDQKI